VQVCSGLARVWWTTWPQNGPGERSDWPKQHRGEIREESPAPRAMGSVAHFGRDAGRSP